MRRKTGQIAKTNILLKYTQVNFQCYHYEFPGCVGVEQPTLLNNLISTPTPPIERTVYTVRLRLRCIHQC